MTPPEVRDVVRVIAGQTWRGDVGAVTHALSDGEHIEVVGDPTVGAVVRREDPRGLRGVFTIGSSGELLGAVTFDDARLARASRRLIDRGAPVDAVALADPEVSARELVRPPK